MKKIILIITLILSILIVFGAFFVLKGNNRQNISTDGENQAEIVPEIALDKRPVVSLTPSEDGHWLKLEIQKIQIKADTLDYELTYKVPDGRTQGVPGTVKLAGTDNIIKDLLLGSESSGKFRYDEGVQTGNINLTFRDQNGKLVAKFSTDFILQSGNEQLEFADGHLFTLDKLNVKTFYISMNTIGYPDDPSFTPKETYGIFSSQTKGNSGKLDVQDVYLLSNGDWVKIENGKAPNTGFFILN